MQWSTKVQLIIAISFALLFLPCVFMLQFNPAFREKQLEMSLLFSIKNIICL